ncbi:hypothetical protein V5740_07320 [Croceibacterium sp. TMG7-5b_MA50]|uniref:hypothetical protein n=1 Tax=Croceibacterium sp. TMG7-5b_MA50 TaxID=3121290 RepID=UPI0032221A94
MKPHVRAMVAAATFASVTGRKVAGIYDHAAGHDRRIAAECRGDRLQGFDGDRSAGFGGTLPEIYSTEEVTFVSFVREGDRVTGHDRGSGTSFEARVADGMVQVYDHGAGAWFSYDVQDAAAAQSYHRR